MNLQTRGTQRMPPGRKRGQKMFTRMIHPAWYLSAVLASLLFFPPLIRAADLNGLSRDSQVIVLGKAVGTRCQWAETSMNILTYTTFHVERSLKGGLPEGKTVIIETLGGSINGMTQRAPASPCFHNEEYALVFLNPGEKGVYLVSGDKKGVIPLTGKGNKRTTEDGTVLSRLIRDVNLVLAK